MCAITEGWGPAAAKEFQPLDGSSEDLTHFAETTGLRSATNAGTIDAPERPGPLP